MFGPIFNLICDEARKIWCFRWLMAAVSGSIFAVAAIVILALPNTFKSSGQIMISDGNTLTKAAEGVTLDGVDYADTSLVQKKMMTDQVLRDVYKRAYPQATAAEAAAAAAGIGGRAKVNPEGDKLIEFSYSDSDPVRTQKVTKALIDQFIVENLNRNVRELDQAGAFLDQQIASYSTKLAAVRTEMAAFRQKHPRVAAAPITVTDSSGGGDLAGARAELAAALSRAPRATPTVAPQDAAIADSEGRLAGLLTQYTEQHPDVISLRRQIAALKAQRAQFIAAAPAPVATVDPAVAAARARLASAQARTRASAAPTADTSDISTQWAELSRRHDTLVESLQQLVTRREGAKMARALYGAQDTGIYQITREPSVPAGPNGPPRAMYLIAAAVIALGAGIAAAYLRAGIAGIFVSPREVENAFQLPVIGTVSWEPAWHVSRSKRSTPALPAR